VGAVIVVVLDVFLGLDSHLFQSTKDVCVEQFAADASVKAFDIGVLRGFSGLYVGQGDFVEFAPLIQLCTDKFRAIVYTDHLGEPAFGL